MRRFISSQVFDWILIGMSLLILAGLFHIPAELLTREGLQGLGRAAGYGPAIWIIGLIGTMPLLPGVGVWLHLSGRRWFGRWSAVGLVLLSLGPVALMVMVYWVLFAGPGTEIAFGQAVAHVLGLVAVILLLTKSNGPWVMRASAAMVLMPPVALAIWSLSSVPSVVVGARAVAGDRPFCVAFHKWEGEVRRFSDLRGTVFYTTNTGYKDSSRWYWHGILKVEGDLYNWSPRHRRFDKIPYSNSFLARPSPRAVCEPVAAFWRSVGWY